MTTPVTSLRPALDALAGQAVAIRVLHARLGRPLPKEGIAHLTHEQAGDKIISLRDEWAAMDDERTEG